jgi:hypothetical protein
MNEMKQAWEDTYVGKQEKGADKKKEESHLTFCFYSFALESFLSYFAIIY